MSLRQLPAIQAFQRPDGLSWDAPSDAMERWSPGVMAAESDEATRISIYDVIGEDYWSGGGWTAKRLAGTLRAIGKKDVTVAINSPGGDVFEGIAMYNLLREHPAQVSVKVTGLAASAASIIAMAGDTVAMGRGAFLMIHNAWGVVVGNRHDMTAAAEMLAPIDDALAEIYVARTGQEKPDVVKMLDDETWLHGAQAIDLGFADALMDDEPAEGAKARADVSARHRLDTILAKQGMPRSERRRLLRDINQGMPGAAPSAMHDAGLSAVADDLRRLIASW